MSRLRRLAETVARHPRSDAALQRLGVDVESLREAPREARRRPDPNPNSDGPGDAAPYRRDYQNFERDRS